VKDLLLDNPELMEEIEKKIKEKIAGVAAPVAAEEE
jgi:hypothetical protein